MRLKIRQIAEKTAINLGDAFVPQPLDKLIQGVPKQ